ncbi:hypothetical protein COO60DRAFT_1542128 [Scenedesmus sp. NREL 46B-D3]|nr:hypothetical protein COO60DRAFT_1542128 [Scenedesmus sp. NREL 46B-D3]
MCACCPCNLLVVGMGLAPGQAQSMQYMCRANAAQHLPHWRTAVIGSICAMFCNCSHQLMTRRCVCTCMHGACTVKTWTGTQQPQQYRCIHLLVVGCCAGRSWHCCVSWWQKFQACVVHANQALTIEGVYVCVRMAGQLALVCWALCSCKQLRRATTTGEWLCACFVWLLLGELFGGILEMKLFLHL